MANDHIEQMILDRNKQTFSHPFNRYFSDTSSTTSVRSSLNSNPVKCLIILGKRQHHQLVNINIRLQFNSKRLAVRVSGLTCNAHSI